MHKDGTKEERSRLRRLARDFIARRRRGRRVNLQQFCDENDLGSHHVFNLWINRVERESSRKSKEVWVSLFEEYRKSGETMDDFCWRKFLNPDTFYTKHFNLVSDGLIAPLKILYADQKTDAPEEKDVLECGFSDSKETLDELENSLEDSLDREVYPETILSIHVGGIFLLEFFTLPPPEYLQKIKEIFEK